MRKDVENICDSYKDLIGIAKAYAVDCCAKALSPSHIFKALLHKDFNLISFIEKVLDKDYYYLVDWADNEMAMCLKSSRPSSDVEMADETLSVFKLAEDYMSKIDVEGCDYHCILASLVTPGVGFGFNELKTMPLTPDEVFNALNIKCESSGKTCVNNGAKGGLKGLNAVPKYCINKNEMAAKGEIDHVVGFEREISSFFEVLGRKTKSNILVVGESGVGKTSLVNGFVLRLMEGNVPRFLEGVTVYELNLASLSGGAINKMEIEDRFKSVISELQEEGRSVLVIDGFDKMMDKQSSLYGICDMFKNVLNRGNLLTICTASVDGFTKNIETDKEMVRKFEKISVDEPDADSCFRIIKGSVAIYEEHHGLEINDVVINDAIRLSKRYMTDKALPDSAFDLIDRTMALVNTMNDVSDKDICLIKEKIKALEMDGIIGDESKSVELNWLHYELFNKVSCLLTAQLDDDTDFSKIVSIDLKFKYLYEIVEKLEQLTSSKRTSIQSGDLFAVVAKQTGVPLGKVQSKEREKLVNAEEIMKRRVVGQDHAIKVILDSIYESRSGLNKKGQPMGSFFFLGPTGTGKTELSKALAEFLFQDESALIRFDMSEFKEEHSVALLYGAPPGYVGYEEGGLLVNKIRQKPYSVVLFDEIEKAHKSVFDLFLQILDEGKLHDRLGRVGDFSNALILFTSNIGSQFIMDSFGRGVIPQNSDLMEIMQGYFRPEFLARLTEIVPFSPITDEIVTMIFNIHLKGLVKLLAEQGIRLEIDDANKHDIAMKGFSPQFGARPVIGIIRKELRRPLSKLIISGKLKSGDTVKVLNTGAGVSFEVNGSQI